MIAIASVISMFFVKLYGIIVFNYIPAPEMVSTITNISSIAPSYTIETLMLGLGRTIKDMLPIIVIIFGFQYLILRRKTSLRELVVNIL